jgi:hypothetical protein
MEEFFDKEAKKVLNRKTEVQEMAERATDVAFKEKLTRYAAKLTEDYQWLLQISKLHASQPESPKKV